MAETSEIDKKNSAVYPKEIRILDSDTIKFLTEYIGLSEDELKPWIMKMVKYSITSRQ